MNIKKISPSYYVSAQIGPDDTRLAAAEGIKTIICNRPDGEAAGQPASQEIAAAAADAGVEFLHIPVSPGSISDESIIEFATACENSAGPVLAYCGSGMRAACLWALAQVESQPIEKILTTAQDAGFSLTDLRPRLEAKAQAASH